jgi:hypothetical protein
VRLERRGDLHHQRSELLILDDWQQRRLYCCNHVLVELDFALQKRAIELSAAKAAQPANHSGLFLGVLIARVRRRSDTELFSQIASLLANHLMVTREHGAKLTHLVGVAALGGKLSSLYVDGVGIIEDCHDCGVVQRRCGRFRRLLPDV